METPAVSLLVAVYNTETYIRNCLESLKNQTLDNIEIIIVNDGSADASPDIAEEYAEKDKRFRVIHQENQGLGAVRNKGIEAARGEFVAFIDSDDWIEPDYCLQMVQAASEETDLVICNYAAEFEDTEKTVVSDIAETYQDQPKESYIKALFEGKVRGFSWNKLYRRSMIDAHRLSFPLRGELEHVEDQFFSFRAHFFASSVSYVKAPLYHYRIHLSSIVQGYQKKLFESGLALYQANARFLQENNKLEEYRKELDFFIVLHSTICLLNEWKTSASRRLLERLKTVGVICADPVFQGSLSKTGTAPFDAKRSCLLLMAKYRMVPFVAMASAVYQRVIEYKMKIRG
ncbi:glycosyltransferase family 2 protein [Bacillus halotolerans]|uniref:glycosyltransferase family 2 protein n=1 Tax=Bacillus halotolerans TaxID=260554 RepID=UPI000D063FD9|nr:glycosyltransferase [Bacillus halotolerans]PSA97676.1 glycosyl transferase [Bacillus halotolerans]